MTIQELYTKIGGDYEEAIDQFEEDELLDGFVRRFPEDPTFQLFMQAVEKKDIEQSFCHMHTFKGVASNFSFSCLLGICEKLTEQLRPKSQEADEELVEQLVVEYKKIIDTIKEYSSQ